MSKPSSYSNTRRTSQSILNDSFDEEYRVLNTAQVESDGTNLIRKQSSLVAMKVTESGSDTYVAIAPIGTAQATAGWQAKKITVSGADTTITWCDGNANFDNVATDLTALSYS